MMSATRRRVLQGAAASTLLDPNCVMAIEPLAGYVCNAPILGPTRRLSMGQHVAAGRNYPLSGPYQPFAEISDLFYQTIYFNTSTMTKKQDSSGMLTNNVIDHSDQGMIDHARYYIYFLLKQSEKLPRAANVMWWDLEKNNAEQLNAPPIDGWTPTVRAAAYIATYDKDAPPAFRRAAIRWQAGVAKACHEIAREQGITNFEIGHYNAPSKVDYPGNSSFVSQAEELNAPFLCPYISFGGPSMYFSTGQYRSLNEYISYATNMVKQVREAFGQHHRILPAIWPRFYFRKRAGVLMPNSAGDIDPNDPSCYPGSTAHSYPAGSYMVPSGFMRSYVSAILDAGADGFFAWRSSADDDLEQPVWQERWGEIVDVIKRRGTFVRPS